METEIWKAALSLQAARRELDEVHQAIDGDWIPAAKFDQKEYDKLIDRREELKAFIYWKLTGRNDY